MTGHGIAGVTSRAGAALCVFAFLTCAGCVAYSPTNRVDPGKTRAADAEIDVVRLAPGDQYSRLSAVRVSNALVSLLGKMAARERVRYFLDAKDAPRNGRGYVIRGQVFCGEPSSAVNLNMVWKTILKITVFWVNQAPAVKHRNYSTSVRASVELLERPSGRTLWHGELQSKARGTYGENDEGDVEERVMAVAEHNLAAKIAEAALRAISRRESAAGGG